ncbi:hypothetical protein ACS0TY_023908 [Phlomoides rotata]
MLMVSAMTTPRTFCISIATPTALIGWPFRSLRYDSTLLIVLFGGVLTSVFIRRMLELIYALIFGYLVNLSTLIIPAFYIHLISVYCLKLLLIPGVLVLCMLGPRTFRGGSFGPRFVPILIALFASWGILMWCLVLMNVLGVPGTLPVLLRSSWPFLMRLTCMIWILLVLSLLGLLVTLIMVTWLLVWIMS